jgi:hypothetical protein
LSNIARRDAQLKPRSLWHGLWLQGRPDQAFRVAEETIDEAATRLRLIIDRPYRNWLRKHYWLYRRN